MLVEQFSKSERQHLRSPEELVKFLLYLPPYSNAKYNLASITHRQNLVKLWRIPTGARVLEIGAGQGDFTVPVADAVGPSGHVVALDPIDPNEGTPPIGRAQAHVKASPVGPQIDFLRMDGASYLKTTTEKFDFLIIPHTAWYFSEPAVLREIVSLAVGRATSILIAEFAIAPCRPEAVPHLLTALATNALESFRDETSWRNQCCGLTPGQIISGVTGLDAAPGWVLREQSLLTTPSEFKYGWREATMILNRPYYVEDVKELNVNEKTKSMLLGMREALAASMEMLSGGMDAMQNLNVWAARFELDKEGI